MIAGLVPPGVAAVDGSHFGAGVPAPHPEEAPLIAAAVEKRRHEFALGRACARAALAALGEDAGVPILRGERREPVWPAGIVGSITHTGGYVAAVAARATEVRAIGIDAEGHRALPERVAGRIATPEELDLPDGAHWDAVVFSAKEALFKAWWPMTRQWLDFDEARMTVDPAAGRFRAEVLIAVPPGVPSVYEGRFATSADHVVTAVCVAAGSVIVPPR